MEHRSVARRNRSTKSRAPRKAKSAADLNAKEKKHLAKLRKQKGGTPLEKLRREIQIAKLTSPKKLPKGQKLQRISIPARQSKIEQFAMLAEKDPTGFNSLKESKEYFGFKIEGNQSRTIFKDIGELVKMLRAYLKAGSAKEAKFEIIRIHGSPASWKKAKRGDDKRDTRAAISNFKKRRQRRLKKLYKGQPYD